jgi:hypothetical protein
MHSTLCCALWCLKNFGLLEVILSLNFYLLSIILKKLWNFFYIASITLKERSLSSFWPLIPVKTSLFVGLYLWAHLQALQFVATHFPKCWFPTIANDICIIGPPSIIWTTFEYLTSKLNEIVLSIQPHKGVTWSPSCLLNNFTPNLV